MAIEYVSTRGLSPAVGFEQVLLTGLAPDGGLYLPRNLPTFDANQIKAMARMSYTELAFEVMHPFVGDAIEENDFKVMIDECYRHFRHHAVAPLVQLGHNEWILELFHGPTLAFKDFALQLLGRLFDYVLQKRNQKAVILGATSGDTGSAAIEGCRHCEHVDIFILHPHQRVSDVQRKQMTTVIGDNIHNLALKGNFDDCQSVVKASFADQSFLPEGKQLVAVNSINWARIMAQIVYYFYASVALGAPFRSVAFSVPTGNFGDIFAGFLAKKMGLPVAKLIIASNANDILFRAVAHNSYQRKPLLHTLSPSMDIMVSSNFERLLWDLFDEDSAQVRAFMASGAALPEKAYQRFIELFAGCTVSDEQTCATIRAVFEQNEYVLDPHSAIGVHALRKVMPNPAIPVVSLATAHPAKFPDAITKAGLANPSLPVHMASLWEKEERFDTVENDVAAVQQYVAQRV